MQKVDVIIVGTGPAGAFAAYTAAAAGRSVLLVEKECLPRYKTCGGGLVWRGRKLLPFDISPAIEREFTRAHVYFEHLPDPVFATREEPIVTMVMRDTFDQLIVEEARKLGAELLEQAAVTAVRETAEGVEVDTKKGTYTGSYLIAADGMLSPTAKLAGFKDDRQLIPAIEYEVGVSEADFARLAQEVRFDVDAIPKGYGWCFPKKNHLSIGVGTFERRKINLRTYYQSYLKLLGIQETTFEEAHGFQVPITPRSQGIAKGRVLLVGDAAGFADSLTAEGISNALYTGKLAAEAIHADFHQPQAVVQGFQALLDASLIPELGTSHILARMFYGQKTIRNFMLGTRLQEVCDVLTGVFMGERTYPVDMKKRALQRIRQALF
ncbi:geranylgeranyl reductase [Nitritalea halalkaliphila LW7]|uniref:Geranylgeranyl reductase n=1 Tax=Nitritalea halalkaliphila LW7 TaxID=1189621 RepID=I5C946_9BACT|nr:geranylgeranyl reductase family protein [Nitritalea halalkaliphila]EIM78348.1 geranylgeranyl reductase [Nitritalea halalkaliphila LW7]